MCKENESPKESLNSAQSPFTEAVRKYNEMVHTLKSPVTEEMRRHKEMMRSFQSPAVEAMRRQSELTQALQSPAINAIRWNAEFTESLRSPVTEAMQRHSELSKALRVENLQSVSSSIAQWKASLPKPISSVFPPEFASVAHFNSPISQFEQISKLMRDSYNIKAVSTFYATLDQLDINQVAEIAEEFNPDQENNIEKQLDAVSEMRKPRLIKDMTEDEFLEMMGRKLPEMSNTEPSVLKSFLREVLVDCGVELFRFLMRSIYFYLYYWAMVERLDYHDTIILAIQRISSESASGYGGIASIVRQEGYSEYEFINCIGLIRVETVLRDEASIQASHTHPEKLKVDTVVSIMGQEGSWIKVRWTSDDDEVEGWVEESKVIRFRKEASDD